MPLPLGSGNLGYEILKQSPPLLIRFSSLLSLGAKERQAAIWVDTMDRVQHHLESKSALQHQALTEKKRFFLPVLG